MSTLAFTIVAAAVLAFGLVSRRLERSVVTAPMFFVAVGYLIGVGGERVITDAAAPAIHHLAEITLVLVLFTDAARIDAPLLRRDHDLPVRMLLVGMPLTILAGLGVALLVFPEWSFWKAAVLAAILTPTDAALGLAVVNLPVVPERIRQAIAVESGLNDGIALPIVLIFVAAAGASLDPARQPADWVSFTAKQVTLGPLVGVAVGYLGGRVLSAARVREWMSETFADLSVLSLALLAFALAELVGGNGFIAAFVGGLTIGHSARGLSERCLRFGEEEGTLLVLSTFLLFGATTLPEALPLVGAPEIVYAALSLTVVRMVPVALSLLGKGLDVSTVAFLGWFGPRGLATIIFGLLVVGEAEIPGEDTLLATAVLAVLLSTVLHGVTAYPLAHLYGRRLCKRSTEPENRPVSAMSSRHTARARGPASSAGDAPSRS